MSPRQWPRGSYLGSSSAAVGTGKPDHHRFGSRSCRAMLRPLGLTLPPVPPLLHFSRRLPVHVWWLARVADRPSPRATSG